MGYIGVITHLLILDPNFQRDIPVVGDFLPKNMFDGVFVGVLWHCRRESVQIPPWKPATTGQNKTKTKENKGKEKQTKGNTKRNKTKTTKPKQTKAKPKPNPNPNNTKNTQKNKTYSRFFRSWPFWVFDSWPFQGLSLSGLHVGNQRVTTWRSWKFTQIWVVHSLKLTATAPENRPFEGNWYSNHPFSGALISSKVTLKRYSFPRPRTACNLTASW